MKERDLYYNLWLVFRRNGFKGNLVDFYRIMNTDSEIFEISYDLSIKQNELRKILKDESEYKVNLSIEEFKTLLDIGYANLINEEYINAMESTRGIN